MSRSLRRKNVVGPDGPGFEVAGGLKVDLLDLSVRASDGAYMLSVGGVVGNENERVGTSESIGGVLSDSVYMGDATRGIGWGQRQDPRCRGLKTEGP
jgi:hypothetical protein